MIVRCEIFRNDMRQSGRYALCFVFCVVEVERKQEIPLMNEAWCLEEGQTEMAGTKRENAR